MKKHTFNGGTNTLVDIVWACFLDDNENDEISGISEEETFSNRNVLTAHGLDPKKFTTKRDNYGQLNLKKTQLIASLKRSTELLAYSKKLDNNVQSLVRDKKCQGEDNRDTNLDLDERDNKYLREGLEANHVDTDSQFHRAGPPKIIFIKNQDEKLIEREDSLTNSNPQQTIIEDVKSTVEKTKQIKSLNEKADKMSRTKGVVQDSGNFMKLSTSNVVEGQQKDNILSLDESTRAELKQIEQKKLLLRISLLRIRAAKARLAKNCS